MESQGSMKARRKGKPSREAPARQRASRAVPSFTSNLVDVIHEPVVVTDRSLRVLSWNSAMERLTGHARSVAVGRLADDVLPFLVDPRIASAVRSALEGNEARSE